MKDIDRNEAITLLTKEVRIIGWFQFSNKELQTFLISHDIFNVKIRSKLYFKIKRIWKQFQLL